MTEPQQKLLAKLLKRRTITEDGCWITGSSGKIKVNNDYQLIHRISAFIHLNFNLDGRLICHKCRTRYCWNPDHLYIGDTHSNNLDAVRDGTYNNRHISKIVCDNGHLLSGDNLYLWKQPGTGKIYRQCRACKRDWINNKNRNNRGRQTSARK